jgi:hypothetical protein
VAEKAEESCAGRLGVLGGILGACRSEGDFVLDVVVPADKAVGEGTAPQTR